MFVCFKFLRGRQTIIIYCISLFQLFPDPLLGRDLSLFLFDFLLTHFLKLVCRMIYVHLFR